MEDWRTWFAWHMGGGGRHWPFFCPTCRKLKRAAAQPEVVVVATDSDARKELAAQTEETQPTCAVCGVYYGHSLACPRRVAVQSKREKE